MDDYEFGLVSAPDNRHPCYLRSLLETSVQCSQGQTSPEGYFQIGGVINGQPSPTRELKDRPFFVSIVDYDAKGQTVFQRSRYLLL